MLPKAQRWVPLPPRSGNRKRGGAGTPRSGERAFSLTCAYESSTPSADGTRASSAWKNRAASGSSVSGGGIGRRFRGGLPPGGAAAAAAASAAGSAHSHRRGCRDGRADIDARAGTVLDAADRIALATRSMVGIYSTIDSDRRRLLAWR